MLDIYIVSYRSLQPKLVLMVKVSVNGKWGTIITDFFFELLDSETDCFLK